LSYVYHDDCAGATERSVEYFRGAWSRFKRISKPVEIAIDADRSFSFELFMIQEGRPAWILVSGCNCGYRGTGPRGSLTVLREIFGEIPREVEDAVLGKKHVRVDARTGMPRLAGDA
jgi:hypothetical protein